MTSPNEPGYPLLNVLHYAVSRVVRAGTLPVPSIRPPTECAFSTPGTVAWAANALSGVLGAAASVLICLTIEEWTRGSRGAYNRGGAAAGALLFCFSPLTWEYSTGSEVFALNNLLVTGALYLTARIVGQPDMKAARVGAVVSVSCEPSNTTILRRRRARITFRTVALKLLRVAH